jgi:hypothetical protein
MPFRPNFTALELDGDFVLARGLSDGDQPSDLADLLAINVTLVQGTRIARGSVDKMQSDWVVRLPVQDLDGGDDFKADDAAAFGVEIRRENATTISWTQVMAITQVPD